MIRKLLKSVREYKTTSILTPIFISADLILTIYFNTYNNFFGKNYKNIIKIKKIGNNASYAACCPVNVESLTSHLPIVNRKAVSFPHPLHAIFPIFATIIHTLYSAPAHSPHLAFKWPASPLYL